MQLAYLDPDYPYASLETIHGEAPENILHTRDKSRWLRARWVMATLYMYQKHHADHRSKRVRKCGFFCLVVAYNMVVGVLTLFLWHLYYLCRVIYVAWNT